MPWNVQKEKTLKIGRGAPGSRPTSVFKAGNALLAIPFNTIRAPKGREVSKSSSKPKVLLKKQSLPFLSGDADGDFVLIAKAGHGSLSNTPGRKASSKIPKISVRRPTSVAAGLDLLAGNGHYSLRASVSLYTLDDTDMDEDDMSHHITPFVISDYDSTPPLSASASSFPSSPPSSASIYTQSSGFMSSTGLSLPSFSYASSVTINSSSTSPSLVGSLRPTPSRLNLNLPPKLDFPEHWFTTPPTRSVSASGWFASPDRDSYKKEK